MEEKIVLGVLSYVIVVFIHHLMDFKSVIGVPALQPHDPTIVFAAHGDTKYYF